MSTPSGSLGIRRGSECLMSARVGTLVRRKHD